MHISRSVILVTGLVALTGCSSSKHPDTFIKQSTVCVDKGWYGYHPGKGCPSTVKVAAPDPSQEMAARLAALERDQRDQKDRLAAELAATKQRIADLEGQLGESKGSLAQAERDLLKALQPELSKGTVSANQTGDALTINLASSLLFDSGQDQLKAGGADALQRVGGVLKDFPEKQVHVAGYTDKVPVKGALLKKYPSNKELSDARANGAAQALRDGGVANLTAAGHGESDPIASNNTAAGRAKNRRVEVVVK